MMQMDCRTRLMRMGKGLAGASVRRGRRRDRASVPLCKRFALGVGVRWDTSWAPAVSAANTAHANETNMRRSTAFWLSVCDSSQKAGLIAFIHIEVRTAE